MKVGIIGCGYVCDTYMSTWARHPKLELAGVTDRDQGRAEAIASRYGLRRYATNAELLADPEIGVVVNLTSIASHAEVTREVVRDAARFVQAGSLQRQHERFERVGVLRVDVEVSGDDEHAGIIAGGSRRLQVPRR